MIRRPLDTATSLEPQRGEVVLDVRDLCVGFDGRNGHVPVVRGASFTVRRGETLVILGESGSGKSVTAEAIVGTLQSPPARVTGGQALFLGEDLMQLSAQRRREVAGTRIGLVSQDTVSTLNPVLTVGWQMGEVYKVHRGDSMRTGQKRSIELLRRVSMPAPERRVDEYPHQFSGGMRQRTMIALGMSLSPDLLIADEPTTALDVTVQAQIVELLLDVQKEMSSALIMITHNIALASQIADRIAVMYAGRIVESGTVRDVIENPKHPYTRALIGLARTRAGSFVPIPGSPPDPAHLPSGCAFSPRCAEKIAGCEDVVPRVRTRMDGRVICCHLDEGE